MLLIKKNPSLEKRKGFYKYNFTKNYFVIFFKSAIVSAGFSAPKT